MKFTIAKQVFLDGLKMVAGVVSSKTTLPILSNVKIDAKDGQLRFTATDMDVCMTGGVPANVTEEGTVTLPAKKLVSIVSALTDGEVSVVVNDKSQAAIECGPSKFKINGLPSDDFPVLPSFQDATTYTVEQNVLREGICRTEYAISTDTSRYVLNGISMIFRNGKLTIVATDGRRLALAEAAVEYPDGQDQSVIVPTKAVGELRRFLSDKGTVTIRLNKTQACFEINDSLLITKLIDGSYPDYKLVFPDSYNERVTLPVADLLATVSRVSNISDKLTNVQLHFKNDELEVSAFEESVGSAQETLGIAYTGNDLQISFNPDFFMAPLRTLPSDSTVMLDLIDERSPGVLRIGDEFLYVLMPMRA